MSRNEILRNADTVPLSVPAGVKAGEPVRVGGFVGVAITDRAQSVTNPSAADYNRGGGNAEGQATVRIFEGIWNLEVTGAATTFGASVYILEDRTLTTDGTAPGAYHFGATYVPSKTAAKSRIPVVVAAGLNSWLRAQGLA